MHSEGGTQYHQYAPKQPQIYASSAPMMHHIGGHAPEVGVNFTPSQAPPQLPKVGQTRCYWALLAPDLTFVYLDPVLAIHLQDQAHLIIGAPLLSFVHPDEQASARADLGSVIEGRALHGSVTRVRFARLSKVQSRVAERDIPKQWADADKIAIDAAYMAVDITINWIAEGLVLCFLHAATNLGPQDDDPTHRTAWSNWCGTPFLAPTQIQLLVERLIARPAPSNSGPPTRVFQILANNHGRPLMMSWPPAPGSIAHDLANLAEDIDVSTIVVSEAKTSCTRRHTKVRVVPSLGAEVESVYIPHGSIIFACHKIAGYTIHQDNNHQQQSHQMPPSNHNHYPQAHTPHYDPYIGQQPHAYSPPHQFIPPLHSQYQQQPYWIAYPPHPQQIPGWSHSPSSVPPHSPSHHVAFDPQPQRWQAQGHSHYLGFQSNLAEQQHHSLPIALPSPAPINQTSHTSPHSSAPLVHPSGGSRPSTSTVKGEDLSPSPPSHSRARASSSVSASRPPAHRPLGILKCTSCQTTQSPEWRKGPSGKKELCNACGLRFARSRAKQDGVASPANNRKRKISKPKSASKSSPSLSPTMPSSSPEASGPSTMNGETAGANGVTYSQADAYPSSSYDARVDHDTMQEQHHGSDSTQSTNAYDDASISLSMYDQHQHQQSQMNQHHDQHNQQYHQSHQHHSISGQHISQQHSSESLRGSYNNSSQGHSSESGYSKNSAPDMS